MQLTGKKLLVTGARSPIALALMQQFIEAGNRVWTTDSVPFALSKHLAGIEGFTQTAPCRFDPHAFIADINEQIEDFGIDLIIPTNEETFWLSRFRADLEAPLFAADFEIMAVLHHKEHYARVLNAAGLKTPKAYDEHGEDRILKDYYSRFTALGDGNDQLPHFYQQKISGKEWCLSAVAEKGKMQVGIVYDKEINFRGSSSILIGNHDRPDILAALEKLIDFTDFTGLIGCDVIESDQDGELYFIDINPRGTSGLVLLTPEFWSEGKLTFQKPRRTNIALLPYFFKHPFQTQKIFANSESYFKGIAVKHPFFLQLNQVWNWWRYSKREHINFRQATVYDIEWDGEGVDDKE
ncbi:ATP-grasp domain-containing protein [Eupransor demetentiae]|uniref:ATP-grasp superfamily (PylC) n=1 Tax=Eupransor demetentiae TaxID=3109584 RepID=A0ABM9N493_9LACO|nr:ATP-grasp superfamily (PylC) [Lactobacillaceae bacterium LMG 33000]